jgi:hypothetical protein
VIATLETTLPPTWIVDPADVAVGVAAHGSLEVITTVITSLFANVVLVYVEELAPLIAVPFNCH